ncbi:MAG: hypothetical protein GQ558_06020, partial [Thermoplasmata archaeon]|nr:hypothetical protein [Thermoplasmata archaeon]
MKVAIVTYGLINRRVALMLRERGIEVVVFEDAELWADMAREDGMECCQALVSDPEADGPIQGTEVFVMMDVDALRVDRLAKSFRRKFPKARIIASDVGIQELPYLETYTGEGHAMRVGQEALARTVVSKIEEHMAKRS